jgi:predicted amidohydrolase
MFTCGFSRPTDDLARQSYESGAHFLSELARQHNVYAIGSLPQPVSPSRIFNTALVSTPDGSTEHYQKIHLFAKGGETSPYAAGSSTLTTKIKDVRCSVFICYDLRFPLPFHQCAEHTDLFVVIANWPTPRREHWLTLLRARAIENQAYVAGVNRTGTDPGLTYSGDSVLFAPDGTQMTELTSQEGIIMCDVDPGKVNDWRTTFPAVGDRRPEVYRGL